MLSNRSLVIASLEMGRMLADYGKVKFRARGTCMSPCIQPGDELHIQSRTIEQVQVGDITVFRRENFLLGHRVITKSTQAGKPFIITRPDRTRHGDDGPSFAADVLGVVTAIERRAIQMPLHPQPLQGRAALRAAAWEWWNGKMLPQLSKYVAALQHHAWYHRLASVWFNLGRPRFSFVVRVPLTANQSHDLYREISPEAFDLSQTSSKGKPVTSWLLALHLNGTHSPSASAMIDWHPEGCPHGAGWRIDEMQVRALYRGVGLDEALIRQAQAILARGGMTLQGIIP